MLTGTDRQIAREFQRRLRVFLCHASGDKPAVRDLYRRLCADGIEPWLDEEDLLSGQDWQREILRAVRAADVVIVCLSRASITKAGYVQKEIKFALDVADEQPEGAIFLIPLRLEACEVPERLSRWQWVNLFDDSGYERLMRSLRVRAETLGVTVAPLREQTFPKAGSFREGEKSQVQAVHRLPSTAPEPEMVLIPAGEFLMGSDPQKDKDAEEDELPQHTLYLPDYYIAKTPVTNAQYATFVQAAGHKPPSYWEEGKPPRGKEDHPVVNVSWHDAMAYCRWLSEVTGRPYRLPGEAEWEKGARGTDGRIYPWRNQWDAQRCNTTEGGKRRTTPVGAYPGGASPYGLLDMAGNVWEWCRSLWRPYPYDPKDGREDEKSGDRRVCRGGSWRDGARLARAACRLRGYPDFRNYILGFRLALRLS
jgi:formylglycine-generating enzyme required for sulfatase activity